MRWLARSMVRSGKRAEGTGAFMHRRCHAHAKQQLHGLSAPGTPARTPGVELFQLKVISRDKTSRSRNENKRVCSNTPVAARS
jgi:hypothetical protein